MDEALQENFENGMRAARQGHNDAAFRILQEVVDKDPDHELAWMWLAQVCGNEEDKRTCLSKAAALGTDNRWAVHQLAILAGEATADVDPFAPEEKAQVQVLQCPQCGGGVKLQCEVSNTLVCRFCGSVVDLSADQAKVVGKKRNVKPCQPISPGMTASLDGKPYLVVGWLRLKEYSDGEVYRWEEWLLVNQSDGAVLWLCYEPEKGFTLSEPIPATEGFDPATDRTLPTPDGAAKITERGQASISGIDGELTWRAKLGDSFRYIEAAKGSNQYSVEYTDNEIELFKVTPLRELDVWRALGNEDLVKAMEAAGATGYGPGGKGAAPAAVWLSKAVLWCLLVAGIGGTIYSLTAGERIYHEAATVPTGVAHAFPQIDVKAAGRPHQIKIKSGRMPAGAWAVIQLEAVAADETRYYLGGAETWHESGRDSEGAWDESDYSGNCYFVPTENGPLTLLAELEASRGIAKLPVTITVKSGIWMTRYFVIFCIFCLLGLLITGGIKIELESD